MTKLIIKTILITGLFFVFAAEAKSQRTCKTVEQLTQEKASNTELSDNWDCWRLKATVDGVLNLSGAYLRYVALNYDCVDYSGRNFTKANLWGANLSGVNCSKFLYANFNKADLTGAQMWGADFSGASFVNANLSGATMSGARTFGADFKNVILAKDQKIIRFRLIKMVCTHSDDEGPGNDADMGSIDINLFDDSKHPFNLYNWKAANASEEITVPKGYNWAVNQEILLPDDSKNVEVRISMVESDRGGVSDERLDDTTTFPIEQNSGETRYKYSVSNSDVGFDLYFEIEVIKP